MSVFQAQQELIQKCEDQIDIELNCYQVLLKLRRQQLLMEDQTFLDFELRDRIEQKLKKRDHWIQVEPTSEVNKIERSVLDL